MECNDCSASAMARLEATPFMRQSRVIQIHAEVGAAVAIVFPKATDEEFD